MERTDRSRRRARRAFAVALPVIVWALVEVVLRVVGRQPPADPALAYVSSATAGFSPFVEDASGNVTIRPEWIARGDTLVVHEGARPGEYSIVPAFRAVRFAARKSAPTKRVFVLGGSSTFGLYVARDAAYPALLAQRLANRFGAGAVEVVNLGCAGFASDRCLALLDAVFAYQPDAIVVDCGHNEMLARAVDEPAPSAAVVGWRRRLESSWVYGWLRHALSSGTAERRVDADRLGDIAIFDPSRIGESARAAPSAEFLAATERAFGERMRAIAAAAAAKRVACVFVLPAPNLLAPPHAPAPVATQTLATDRVIARAIEALRAGDVASAHATADGLLAQAPSHPVGHYLKGLAYADAGDAEAARVELELAVDRDARPHRITSGLARVLEETAQAMGVALVDERQFLLRRVDRVAASELFVDHCHPTAAGHRSIAAAIDAVLSPLLETR